MSLYNIEIFDNAFDYVSSTTISDFNFLYDYLALEPTTITTAIIACSRGNYISIYDTVSEQKYWGIVTSIEVEESTQNIVFYPFLKKMDVETYYERTNLADMTCENFIAQLIRQTYVNNADSLQNITGLELKVLSATQNATLNLKDNTHNIYDILLRALKKYYIFVDFEVQISNKKIICTIRKASSTVNIIEADLENIINPVFTFKDTYEMVNKVSLYGTYPEENENHGTTLSTVYYLAGNGVITKTPSTRLTPVVWVVKEFEINENFETEAYEVAYDTLYSEQYDNNIEFEISKDDALINISKFEVGQICSIIKSGTTYSTVFTGFEYVEDEKIKLIFGAIRTEFTKQQLMARS